MVSAGAVDLAIFFESIQKVFFTEAAVIETCGFCFSRKLFRKTNKVHWKVAILHIRGI